MSKNKKKDCFGDHFNCDRCDKVDAGWRSACRRQCEYNQEYRNDVISDNDMDDEDEYDIAGQYKTEY